MQFCIHRDVIGESLDLLFDTEKNTFKLIDGIQPGTWIFGDPYAEFSLDILSKLSDLPIRSSPGPEFQKQFEQLGHKTQIAWRYALPKVKFDEFISGIIGDIKILLDKGCIAYYTETFRRSQVCLRALERANVSIPTIESHLAIESNPTNRSSLLSLKPGLDGFTQPIIYDRCATVTGRLVVESGPKILTLSKKFRDVIRSRYVDGSIYSIDYSSIEPRVMLFALDKIPPEDVYAFVCDNILGGTVTRKQAKITTISLLYGAAESTIGALSGLRNGDLKRTIESINAYFNIIDLHKNLRLQAEATGGLIYNRYGRPIRIDDMRKLVNYYTQSSSNDACLLGFSRGVEFIKRENLLVHPIFIIHDAMMLDVHPDFVPYIENIARECEQVPGFSASLPVKYEEI